MTEKILFAGPDNPAFLTAYPAQCSGVVPAMVICPGGAYGLLAEHEGRDYALWLSSLGIHCFVLNYQLAPFPASALSLSKALDFIHAHADEWNIDTQRIGLVGSSAGAHLITSLFNETTQSVLNIQAPAVCLTVLCYPLISMVTNPHKNSLANLLGDEQAALARDLSAEHGVTRDFPPTFMWHTAEDKSVTPNHSLMFAQRLSEQGTPYTLHIFDTGGHGLGLNTPHRWPTLCEAWLSKQLQYPLTNTQTL